VPTPPVGARAADELHKILTDPEMEHCPVLVFANKQDMPCAMAVPEITEKIGLFNIRDRKWFIQSACAENGDGLYEGLDWLSRTVK